MAGFIVCVFVLQDHFLIFIIHSYRLNISLSVTVTVLCVHPLFFFSSFFSFVFSPSLKWSGFPSVSFRASIWQPITSSKHREPSHRTLHEGS
ncbi:hypothetical protein AB205_0134340 [Aquarana catesbeiana]|uniref:Uncharacterized protein n=1 Tax=Aquarana catesbeiana TaxID=8400 RepID=A0A2G9RGA4_AQUCT|nr:hypothetical protein AB205_0134340 [Aquarana catesbeiana]